MRLGIVGSRGFVEEPVLRKAIESCRAKFGGDLIIVSGGCPDGADAMAKRLALGLNISYKEFPPAHRPHNEHCVKPAIDYGKPYHASNFFKRNAEIAEYCDCVLAFVVKGGSRGTANTCDRARSLGKRVIVYEES